MKIWACSQSRCHWPTELASLRKVASWCQTCATMLYWAKGGPPSTTFSDRAIQKHKRNHGSHFSIRHLALRQTGGVAVSGGQGLVQPGARQHKGPRQLTWLTRQQLQCPAEPLKCFCLNFICRIPRPGLVKFNAFGDIWHGLVQPRDERHGALHLERQFATKF